MNKTFRQILAPLALAITGIADASAQNSPADFKGYLEPLGFEQNIYVLPKGIYRDYSKIQSDTSHVHMDAMQNYYGEAIQSVESLKGDKQSVLSVVNFKPDTIKTGIDAGTIQKLWAVVKTGKDQAFDPSQMTLIHREFERNGQTLLRVDESRNLDNRNNKGFDVIAQAQNTFWEYNRTPNNKTSVEFNRMINDKNVTAYIEKIIEMKKSQGYTDARDQFGHDNKADEIVYNAIHKPQVLSQK